MSEYLSKEEIKQWRSSLEKITLEEFAARLGKKIEEAKPTNDLIDIVLKGSPVVSTADDWMPAKVEKTAAKKTAKTKEVKEAKAVKKPAKTAVKSKLSDNTAQISSSASLREEVRIVFKKALTDREQKVFDYFVENSNKIVYAKDLAALLELPRDYVYKYIKNLRAKIEGDKLDNAVKGGFILHV